MFLLQQWYLSCRFYQFIQITPELSREIPVKPAVAYPFRIAYSAEAASAAKAGHPRVYTRGFLRRRVKSRVFKAETIFWCDSGSTGLRQDYGEKEPSIKTYRYSPLSQWSANKAKSTKSTRPS